MVCLGFHVAILRRGTTCVFLSDLGEFYVSIRWGFVGSFNALQVICGLR
jgi:hypothetical protein